MPPPVRVLAIFCNPKGTDFLRLQSEQRVLQQALRSTTTSLQVVPAATIDDLRSALLGRCFDVIHFSGHGCVDGPLQSLVRQRLSGHHQGAALVPLAVAALKRWLHGPCSAWSTPTEDKASGGSSHGDAERTLCTLLLRPAVTDGAGADVWIEGGDVSEAGASSACNPELVRVELRGCDFIRHRVGALAFEGPTGALEPPKPDVMARLLLAGLEPTRGMVFLNACDTSIQAHWLREHGASTVVYAASRISDAAAAEFSRGFYEALDCGCAIAAAYEQGRIAVELRFDIAVHGCPTLLRGASAVGPPGGSGGVRDDDGGDGGEAVGGGGSGVTSKTSVGLKDERAVLPNPVLEEFFGDAVGTAAPLQELVPMPGSQLAVCDTLPRLVRDGLGRLHPLGSCRSNMPRLEDALYIGRLTRKPPTSEAFSHAHRLLGSAQKLRWGVLQQLGEGHLEQARTTLLHALALIRAVGESLPPGNFASNEPSLQPHAAAGIGEGGAACDSPTALPHNEATAVGPMAPPRIMYVYPELQVMLGEADTSLSLAVVQLHLRDYARAGEHAALALQRYRSMHAPTHAALAQLTLADCALLRGDHAAAEEEVRGALRGFRSLRCILGEAEAMRMLGGLRLAVGDDIAGRPLVRDAVARYDALEQFGTRSPYGTSLALDLLGPEHSTGQNAEGGDGDDADFTSLLEQGGGKRRSNSKLSGGGARAHIGRVMRRPRTSRGTLKKAADESSRKNRCLLRCSCWSFRMVLSAGGDEDDDDCDENVGVGSGDCGHGALVATSSRRSASRGSGSRTTG